MEELAAEGGDGGEMTCEMIDDFKAGRVRFEGRVIVPAHRPPKKRKWYVIRVMGRTTSRVETTLLEGGGGGWGGTKGEEAGGRCSRGEVEGTGE